MAGVPAEMTSLHDLDRFSTTSQRDNTMRIRPRVIRDMIYDVTTR